MNNIANRLGTVGLWGEAREEILRLRAELANAGDVTDWMTEVGRLRAELAAAQKDAERYRWLEEHCTATGLARWMGRHQFLSTAIDAARKESE